MKKIAWIIPDLYTGGMPRVLEELSNEFNKDNNYEQYNLLLKTPLFISNIALLFNGRLE